MPELPEVQTVVSDLKQRIVGDTIVGFWSDWPKAIKNLSLAKFKKEMVGRKILGVRRIGKNIFIDLSGGKTLYLHLKMTGHLIIKSKGQTAEDKKYFADRVNQYVHHSWTLEDRKNKKINLDFSDMRKFAKIVLVDTDKVMELKEIKALGIDAMDPKFDAKYFQALLAKRPKRKIRDILMDQTLIAGIGNIYLSEVLFSAGILPTHLAGKIRPEEAKKLHQIIIKTLKRAIKLRGTSDSDYRDTTGAPGGFQKVLQVYRKTGKKCPKCDTMVQRAKMGQRSVFFCRKCQR
jgi:formamidopyrimidine-DNA glycosylase